MLDLAMRGRRQRWGACHQHWDKCRGVTYRRRATSLTDLLVHQIEVQGMLQLDTGH